MFNYKVNTNLGTQTFSFISLEELFKLYEVFKANVFPAANKFIDYDISGIAEFYHDNKINWLKSSDGKFRAPYEIVHDYRLNPVSNWGEYLYKGEFQFPNILSRVKERMLEAFSAGGSLYKGDNPCPRVSNVVNTDTKLTFEIQRANYFDQVATNLSLDYKHDKDISDSLKTDTLRKWDILQSETDQGKLPEFKKSCLANTIGVALGIVAKNKSGQQVMLMRKRTSNVAVYKNMLHLPFSFALNFDITAPRLNHLDTIQELIKPDFRHEQAEELDLEPSDIDFDKVKPLLFCRDLCRGGKPQFFFELEISTPYEDLVRKIGEKERSKSKKEFASKTIAISIEEAKKSISNFSPELVAHIVAKA
jgi:hypothetical protein